MFEKIPIFGSSHPHLDALASYCLWANESGFLPIQFHSLKRKGGENSLFQSRVYCNIESALWRCGVKLLQAEESAFEKGSFISWRSLLITRLLTNTTVFPLLHQKNSARILFSAGYPCWESQTDWAVCALKCIGRRNQIHVYSQCVLSTIWFLTEYGGSLQFHPEVPQHEFFVIVLPLETFWDLSLPAFNFLWSAKWNGIKISALLCWC